MYKRIKNKKDGETRDDEEISLFLNGIDVTSCKVTDNNNIIKKYIGTGTIFKDLNILNKDTITNMSFSDKQLINMLSKNYRFK